MPQDQLPREFKPLNRVAIKAMLWLNGFAHIVIGLALAASVVMFTWLFFIDVQKAIENHNLIHGFLHALGTLMLLWSISALISAEIRYLMGSKLLVETFIEVVLVLFLRKLIVMPVQDASPSYQEISMWVGGAFVMGLIYVMVRWADKINETS
ncbi:phosphate-starvation-inducible PsiE family protein [Methylotenera versatilis]|uniref:phosphate-starvation-inducible PsiE family protein n=1 Tax=Methylotenera versatilis TaxID=1055487 RepID=UPI000647CDAA|nr:phosphate-starvation-inducible PsiE family protein [Methylotenera versatilis]